MWKPGWAVSAGQQASEIQVKEFEIGGDTHWGI